MIIDSGTAEFLRSVGWTRIRQSNLKSLKLCHALAMYSNSDSPDEDALSSAIGIHALLGALFHRLVELVLTKQVHVLNVLNVTKAALEDLIDSAASERQIYKTWVEDEDSVFGRYAKGYKIIERSDAERIFFVLARPDSFYGKSIADLVCDVVTALALEESKVMHVERDLRFEEHGILFTGKIDLEYATFDGRRVLADIKTAGLWGKVVESLTGKKGQIVAQPDNVAVNNRPQLLHYSMLNMIETGRLDYDTFAVISPANLVPVQTGKAKGLPRGQLFSYGPGPSVAEVDAYMNSVGRMLKLFSMDPSLRMYPEIEGRLYCGGCLHRRACWTYNEGEKFSPVEEATISFEDFLKGEG